MTDRLEKVPPQAIEAEQSVLGAMLLSKEAIDSVAQILKEKYFYRPEHRKIYKAIVDLYDKNEPADLITVSEELELRGQLESVGGRAYLATLAESTPSVVNAAHHAQIVLDKATLNRLIEAANSILTRGYS